MGKQMSIIMMILVGTAIANARIGETEKECDKRYGEILDKKQQKSILIKYYNKEIKTETIDPVDGNGSFFMTAVYFINGKAIAISYVKPDMNGIREKILEDNWEWSYAFNKDVYGVRKDITEEECKVFMRANVGEQAWIPINGESGKTADGKLLAILASKIFSIKSKEYQEYENNKMKEKLSDF